MNFRHYALKAVYALLPSRTPRPKPSPTEELADTLARVRKTLGQK